MSSFTFKILNGLLSKKFHMLCLPEIVTVMAPSLADITTEKLGGGYSNPYNFKQTDDEKDTQNTCK